MSINNGNFTMVKGNGSPLQEMELLHWPSAKEALPV